MLRSASHAIAESNDGPYGGFRFGYIALFFGSQTDSEIEWQRPYFAFQAISRRPRL